MNNEQLIPASAFVTMSTGVLASVQKSNGLPNMNFWIGIAIAYLVVALIAEFNSDIGSGLAVLLMVGALLGNGESLTKYIGTKTGGKIGPDPKPKATKRKGTTVNIFAPDRRVV